MTSRDGVALQLEVQLGLEMPFTVKRILRTGVGIVFMSD